MLYNFAVSIYVCVQVYKTNTTDCESPLYGLVISYTALFFFGNFFMLLLCCHKLVNWGMSMQHAHKQPYSRSSSYDDGSASPPMDSESSRSALDRDRD
jgi:hypothetical protein